MAVPPTRTFTIKQAMLEGFRRAAKTKRTQQIELGEDLYTRISIGEHGERRFLLFQLMAEPEETLAHELAKALGFAQYQVGWHQGKTLRSVTVIEQLAHTDSSPESTKL